VLHCSSFSKQEYARAEDFDMPEIHVYAAEGRTLDQKRQLVKDITDAVVRNFVVPPEVVVVTIIEAPKASKARGGVLFSEQLPPKS
jgi:4-oxalocrotonate tautomerase